MGTSFADYPAFLWCPQIRSKVIRMMRQAAAHSLAQREEDEILGQHLITFAKKSEKELRNCWRRRHAVAQGDCEHCFLEFCSKHPEAMGVDRQLLRYIFHCYQTYRFQALGPTVKSMNSLAQKLDRIPADDKKVTIATLVSFLEESGYDHLCSLTQPALVFSGTNLQIPFSRSLLQFFSREDVQ